ncbi:hypothetical protein Y032_0034g2929 [Ancylostoma ceylanicum]|uniref:Uncharacterized protein n=1 Tax=Ancylostoma ceylanicum TaxID=53326 RepID=A0A016UN20_9BILA|nr:hypothetical protein Y032_0034g2929 [Ancylostoma ceylanicum]
MQVQEGPAEGLARTCPLGLLSTTILHQIIDLLNLSTFPTFAQGLARTCLLGFLNALNTSMTTVLGEGIEFLILSIFPPFAEERGKDASTGVLQCAEHEYDNSLARSH